MTKRNHSEREPADIARKVEELADRLQVPSEAREWLLRCLASVIKEFYRRSRDRERLRMTAIQKIARHDRFRQAVDAILAELEDGDWMHSTLRDKAWGTAWIRGRGSDVADDARRDVDEQVAMVRTCLTEWREDMEVAREVLESLPWGTDRWEAQSHWLARALLLIHETALRGLTLEVTPRRFLDLVFEMASPGHDVAYHLRQARASLRKPVVRIMMAMELGQLAESALQDLPRR
jgi:hypothetical protein